MHARMQVVPGECKYDILGTKLEAKLRKGAAGAWPTLHKSAAKMAANFSNTAVQQPPVYPSSHPRCCAACHAPSFWACACHHSVPVAI
jgi:hypothetical protein